MTNILAALFLIVTFGFILFAISIPSSTVYSTKLEFVSAISRVVLVLGSAGAHAILFGLALEAHTPETTLWTYLLLVAGIMEVAAIVVSLVINIILTYHKMQCKYKK